MSIKLEPTILDLDGKLIEAYERETRASDETVNELNLSTGDQVLATVGVAQIPEYVVLQASNIAKNQQKTWILSQLEQAMVIKSVYIDAPQSDRIDFEVYSGDDKIFDFFLNRSATPYQFPDAPLPPEVSIKIIALNAINFVRIALQPAIILDTLTPDENISELR